MNKYKNYGEIVGNAPYAITYAWKTKSNKSCVAEWFPITCAVHGVQKCLRLW